MNMDRNIILKNLNITLDNIDDLVHQGYITRKELTDIILRRNILAMRPTQKYMNRQLNIKEKVK